MPKVLVVDDEPDAVELIKFNLKAAGFEVVTAADGDEALKKARSLLPDLIVLDVMLPEVDGLEVCKILRRDASVSAISPSSCSQPRRRRLTGSLGLELGADDYVTKPFSPRELVLPREAIAAVGFRNRGEGRRDHLERTAPRHSPAPGDGQRHYGRLT